MIEQLTRTDFAACLNTTFHVIDDPSAAFDLQLTQVEAGGANPGYEVFSLQFHGPAGHFVPQAIHKLEHDRLGELDLFLVPVGQDREGFNYEAVFNRLIQSE